MGGSTHLAAETRTAAARSLCSTHVPTMVTPMCGSRRVAMDGAGFPFPFRTEKGQVGAGFSRWTKRAFSFVVPPFAVSGEKLETQSLRSAHASGRGVGFLGWGVSGLQG